MHTLAQVTQDRLGKRGRLRNVGIDPRVSFHRAEIGFANHAGQPDLSNPVPTLFSAPSRRWFLAAILLAGSPPFARCADELTADLKHWLVEQMPGGSVATKDGALVIEDTGGSTVWLREKITAPVEITYEITPVFKGGAHDRVSDVNCFWMAREPKSDATFPASRSGKFSDYDSLFTYYVGMGGNNNSTTRFRRYDGTAARPLLPEHDLKEKKFLLEANHTYHIRLVARDGVAEYWSDGQKIFTFQDPAPLTSGWFAIRTVKSHLEVRNLRITPLKP